MESIMEELENSLSAMDCELVPIYGNNQQTIHLLVIDQRLQKLIYSIDLVRKIRIDFDEDCPLDEVILFDRLWKQYFGDYDLVTIYKNIKSRLMIAAHLPEGSS